jgi:hypothetical protein
MLAAAGHGRIACVGFLVGVFLEYQAGIGAAETEVI